MVGRNESAKKKATGPVFLRVKGTIFKSLLNTDGQLTVKFKENK